MPSHHRSLRRKPSASHRRVHPWCQRKSGGGGQRQTSRPERRERRWVLLPSSRAASRLVVTRPLRHEGPRCSSGRMTMKFRWLLHRARRCLRAACAWRNSRWEGRKFPNNRRWESPSSRQGEPQSGRRRKSPSSKRGEPRSNGRRKGLWQRLRDLHPKTQASTPRPRLGARVGIAGSRNYTGRPNHKYPCLGVTLPSFLILFWRLTS